MPSIVVLGAGVCGLASAMLLARDGHDVTVLERDPEPAPATLDEAWERWSRGGVAQFRLAHFLHARAREMLDADMPDIRDALLAAGAAKLNPLQRMPPGIADQGPRPGDQRLTTITGRRPIVEYVFAHAADEEPRVDVRRGQVVTGLTTREVDGAPHVCGVRTDAGEELQADLVVDAGGRRSALVRWLTEAGAMPAAEEAEDSGFIYYSRFFGPSNGGGMPMARAPFLSPLGTFSVLTLPGDNGTWSVTIYVAAGDRPLKGLRDEDRFTALLQACPLHAHWLDGAPQGGVEALGGVLDRHRRFVSADGAPVATGVAAVADAWACTNPSLGRGIALGLAHVSLLRDVAREHLGSPRDFARAWDEVTTRELTPWYRATVAVDRARLAEMEALRRGEEPPAPDDMPSRLRAGLPVAMGSDAEIFRAGLEITSCLTLPGEVFARPGLAQRVLEIAGETGPETLPAPSREQVLAIAAG
jgi:2-polyprenyl-6-methoxyphenol hydroxylase-like FAD-dependent oxidoreductase